MRAARKSDLHGERFLYWQALYRCSGLEPLALQCKDAGTCRVFERRTHLPRPRKPGEASVRVEGGTRFFSFESLLYHLAEHI